MLDFLADITAAFYAAFTGFALSLQALAPVMPWHASMLASGLIAAGAAIAGWAVARLIRRK